MAKDIREAIFKKVTNYSLHEFVYFHAHGPGKLHTAGKAVTTMDELKGMKIRATGNSASVITALGGNPVAMAAGLAVMRELLDGGVLDNCCRVSSYFFERLRALQADFPGLITDVRGRGLIVGVQLSCPGGPIVQQCLERGLIMNCTMGTVLRFLPPLTITPADVDAALAILAGV